MPTTATQSTSSQSPEMSGARGNSGTKLGPPSPTKTGSAAFFSSLLTTPFASIFGGSSPSRAAGTVRALGEGGSGGGSSSQLQQHQGGHAQAGAGSKGKARAAIPFGLGPPPSPSPSPAALSKDAGPSGDSDASSGPLGAFNTAQAAQELSESGTEDDGVLRPPKFAAASMLPPDDSPARATLSNEQLQDLTEGVADSALFAPPPPPHASTLSPMPSLKEADLGPGGPRTPARPSPMLRAGSSGGGGGGGASANGTRSASASHLISSANPSSAYATLSRVRTRASAASLRASLRNVSGGASSIISAAAGGGSGNAALYANAGLNGSGAGGTLSRASGFLGGGGSPAANWQEALERAQKIDAYVGKAVFQAGVDYESRPMVVLASCGIPDPREVDHDALFDRIMMTMELFVETDYTLIYFASGGKHAVRWSWIWKTYRRIGRKFRKNLKRLYIVHPTFFSRRFVEVISTGSFFVSPKFARKIIQVQTLSQLATHIPLTQIDIPPEVLQANQAHEPSVTLPSRPQTATGDADYDQQHQMFGVSLEVLMGLHGEKGGIPRVVRDCVEALRTPIPSATTGEPIFPLDSEGLFRRSPPSSLLKTVQEAYDRGHPVNLTLHYQDPNIPAALLKVFFRSLPTCIFPSSLYSTIKACPYPSSGSDDSGAQETVHYIRNVLLAALEPPSAVPLLSYVFELLNEVSRRSSTNRMDAANLATVFAPNLVGSGNIMRDLVMCRVDGIGQMAPAMPGPARNGAVDGALSPASNGSSSTQPKAPPEMSLGTIIKICIERYHEIFDQVDAEIRPAYGSELSAHLEALDVDSRRRPSEMDEAEVQAARLQHQLRRTQAGAAGRLASVSESSVGESVDDQHEDGGVVGPTDGSPTRGLGRGGVGSGLGGGVRVNGGGGDGRRRPPAFTSRMFEESPSHRGGQHGLGLIPPSGSSDTVHDTPSASPLSPRVLRRLADADSADVSMLTFNDTPISSFAGGGGAHSSTMSPASLSSATPTPTPTSASTSLLMTTSSSSSPSPASQSISLPLSPSNRTIRSGKSITGIGGDGYRSPFGAASIGRNSSGSLRLTRDRLRSGSGPSSGGAGAAATSNGLGASAGLLGSGGVGFAQGGGGGGGLVASSLDGHSPAAPERSFLTGTASAVAVSGASVSGLFASPARSMSMSSSTLGHEDEVLEEEEEEEEEEEGEDTAEGAGIGSKQHVVANGKGSANGGDEHFGRSPGSPSRSALLSSSSPAAAAMGQTSNSDATEPVNGRSSKRSHRRGLSEVLEDMESAPASG
ncbi:hypothetical protein V8E36_000178 [Tilletia maclaganii]